MKFFCGTLLFCLHTFFVSGQSSFKYQKDSINSLLAKAPEDTTKVILLMKFGWWWEQYSLDSAAVCYQKMDKLSRKLGYVEGSLKYYANYTFILNHQGKYDEGLKLNLESIELARKKGSKLQLANCLFNTGSSYNNMSRFEDAIDYYIKASKVFEEMNLTQNLAFAYGNIGALFYNIDQPEKGLQYSLKALEKARAVNDTEQIATFLINAGIGASKTNRLQESEKYFVEGLKVADQASSKLLQIQGSIALAELYVSMAQPEKSIEFAMKGLDAARAIDSKYNIMQALKVLAESYAVKLNTNETVRYAQEAILFGKQNNFTNDLHKLYMLVAKAKATQGDFKEGYKNLIISHTLEDSINQKEITKKIEQLEISYQTSIKEKQILELQQTQRNHMLLIGGLTSGIVIILIIGFLTYLYFSNRRKLQEQKNALIKKEMLRLRQEQQLLAAESILRGHEEERTRIAKDLHDGLGGLLSGVQISLSNMKSNMIMNHDTVLVFERSLDMLNNSIQELRRVAHNMMPESLVKFGLATALRDFCASIDSMKVLSITFQMVGEEKRLDSSREIILYRIVQELVNNTLKHSGASTSLVQVVYEQNLLSLTVEDDGRGFDQKLLTKTTGAGWPNIKSRVEYLKGTLDIQTTPGEGTSVNIALTI